MPDELTPLTDRHHIFRPLAVEDLADAVTIAGSAFDEPLTRDGLQALLALPSVFGFAACAGGQLSGFILVRAAGGEAEILWLAVDCAHRRLHIGARLLATALAIAASWGAGRMVLEVAETNVAARTLYAAHGFSVVGRRPGYYRGPDGSRFDGLILARDL